MRPADPSAKDVLNLATPQDTPIPISELAKLTKRAETSTPPRACRSRALSYMGDCGSEWRYRTGSVEVANKEGVGEGIEHSVVESEMRPKKTFFREAAFVHQDARGEVVRLDTGDESVDPDVEAQLDKILVENEAMLQVSVDDDVMVWGNEGGPQLIWSR